MGAALVRPPPRRQRSLRSSEHGSEPRSPAAVAFINPPDGRAAATQTIIRPAACYRPVCVSAPELAGPASSPSLCFFHIEFELFGRDRLPTLPDPPPSSCSLFISLGLSLYQQVLCISFSSTLLLHLSVFSCSVARPLSLSLLYLLDHHYLAVAGQRLIVLMRSC